MKLFSVLITGVLAAAASANPVPVKRAAVTLAETAGGLPAGSYSSCSYRGEVCSRANDGAEIEIDTDAHASTSAATPTAVDTRCKNNATCLNEKREADADADAEPRVNAWCYFMGEACSKARRAEPHFLEPGH